MRRTSSAIGVVRQDVHFPPTYNFASRPSAIGNSRTRSALSRFSVFSFRILAVMSPSRAADASPCSESRHSDHSRTCSQSALFGSAPAICSASAVAFWKSASASPLRPSAPARRLRHRQMVLFERDDQDFAARQSLLPIKSRDAATFASAPDSCDTACQNVDRSKAAGERL
jgi:hypothetical protein